VHQDFVDGIAFVDATNLHSFFRRLASNFRCAVFVWFHEWTFYWAFWWPV
jgi:hypothetical protein